MHASWTGGGLEESTFHVVISFLAVFAVWESMREVWNIPDQADMVNSGPEWLFDVLIRIGESERAL